MSNKRYSDELRNEILKDFDNGIDVPELSRKYNIPKPTIYSWIRKRKDVVQNDNNLKNKVSINVAEILKENKYLKEKEFEMKGKYELSNDNMYDLITTMEVLKVDSVSQAFSFIMMEFYNNYLNVKLVNEFEKIRSAFPGYEPPLY